jgi:hypothetical protein
MPLDGIQARQPPHVGLIEHHRPAALFADRLQVLKLPAALIELAASPYAIMRRVCPYRGENRGPGKEIAESLTSNPGIREHNLPPADSCGAACGASQKAGAMQTRT